MIKNIKNIVIVGGGSAGWMSASALIRAFPTFNITVIESPDIPIVGVGESTLGGIKKFCQYLEIDEKDFIAYTDGSFKISIKFSDFYEKDSGSFHYPFGSPLLNNSSSSTQDWLLKKAVYPETPTDDFVDCYFSSAQLFRNNKFTLKDIDNFKPKSDAAYHFDATKFGSWLKEKYACPRGVNYIQGTVKAVTENHDGIKELILNDDTVITADLFVDCTGFKSLLLGETLKEPFISFEDMLPNNRAWATRMPFKNKEQELEPFTHCTAIGNGWVWNIPLWSRIGTGYVYSDKFISPEDAKEELKKHLMSDKMVCPRTKEEVDSLEFKDIQMRVGIHRQTFVKNVVAIGLSAGFIEPLESNGLFTVHEFLFKLIKTLLRGSVTQWDRDVYNTATYLEFKAFAEFVALHYALSIRNDTPYWQNITSKVYDSEMVLQNQQNASAFNQLHNNKMWATPPKEIAGITYVAVGMNYFILDKVNQQVYENDEGIDFKIKYNHVFESLEKRKNRWRALANNELTLYEFLKQNYYKE